MSEHFTIGRAIGISSFVLDRKDDLSWLESFLQTSNALHHLKRKRLNCTRRTSSFRPFKLRRYEKSSKNRTRSKFTARQKKRLQSFRYARVSNSGFKRLDLHVWHSKRMHMINRYGYILPYENKQIGSKAASRHAKNGCVIHDESYIQPIILSAGASSIENTLIPIIGRDSKAAEVIRTRTVGKEVEAVAVASENVAIGPISIFVASSTQSTMVVWIWAHPALKIALLDVVRSYADSTTAVIDTSDSPLVSRFLLIGIDSSNKLSTIITKFQKNDNLIFLAEALGAEGIRNIWTRGNALSINFRLLNDDSRTASSSDSFVSSMSNRIHWPKNAYDNNVGNLHLKDGVSPRIATVSRHLGITEASKTSENNLDCAIIIRNELGVKNEFLKVLPTYHIIVPTSYGRSFYQKLVFCGMVPIGLKELEFIKCEAGVPSYPRDFPDTLAGENFWKCDYDEQNEKTMRLPSRKKLVGRNLMESLQMMNSESIHNISWISRRLCSTSVVNHGNKTILVHVLVKSLCRGVPKSRAVLLSPTEKDMEQFRLAGNNWKGVVLEKITNSSLCENNLLFGRTVLGMLTSGFGCASGKGTSHHGIAVCSYEKIKQLAMSKQTSILLLHNERSSWLRPMLYRLI